MVEAGAAHPLHLDQGHPTVRGEGRSHPGPSLVIVKSGTMTFYRADDPNCTPLRKSAGEALIDAGNDVHLARNEGATDVVVVITRFLPAGASPRINEPAPDTCGF